MNEVGRGGRQLAAGVLFVVALLAFGAIAYLGKTASATGNYYYYYSSDSPIAVSGTSFTATEGVGVTHTVATFTDPDAGATAAEYSATIDWGDGNTSAGAITGSTGGPFTVAASHTYADEGTYVVGVTITDVDAGQGDAHGTSSVVVSDAALGASCAAPVASFTSFSGSLTTLSDANPLATVGDFTATIHWGDSTSSSGTVSGPTGGPFTISGSHTYATLGNRTVTVDANDDGGSNASTSCQLVMFSFPSSGAFVLGDKTVAAAGPTTKVTWWSSKWSALNQLSGGAASSAFKGFAASVSALPTTSPANVCSGTWSTGGGSSPPPPGTVPQYMGVIVASKITKSPSGLVSGNYAKIVVVKTNPGYSGPSSTGTGTIVGTFCG
jgi:hypothetical protein